MSTIAELFGSLPERIRPEKTEGWKTCVHFKFKDSATPEWTVVIDGARCEVKEGLEGTPNCIVSTTEKVYLDIEAGREDGTMAAMMGKIRLNNPTVMMRYLKSFKPVGR